jgi:hypothetical protein
MKARAPAAQAPGRAPLRGPIHPFYTGAVEPGDMSVATGPTLRPRWTQLMHGAGAADGAPPAAILVQRQRTKKNGRTRKKAFKKARADAALAKRQGGVESEAELPLEEGGDAPIVRPARGSLALAHRAAAAAPQSSFQGRARRTAADVTQDPHAVAR